MSTAADVLAMGILGAAPVEPPAADNANDAGVDSPNDANEDQQHPAAKNNETAQDEEDDQDEDDEEDDEDEDELNISTDNYEDLDLTAVLPPPPPPSDTVDAGAGTGTISTSSTETVAAAAGSTEEKANNSNNAVRPEEDDNAAAADVDHTGTTLMNTDTSDTSDTIDTDTNDTEEVVPSDTETTGDTASPEAEKQEPEKNQKPSATTAGENVDTDNLSDIDAVQQQVQDEIIVQDFVIQGDSDIKPPPSDTEDDKKKEVPVGEEAADEEQPPLAVDASANEDTSDVEQEEEEVPAEEDTMPADEIGRDEDLTESPIPVSDNSGDIQDTQPPVVAEDSSNGETNNEEGKDAAETATSEIEMTDVTEKNPSIIIYDQAPPPPSAQTEPAAKPMYEIVSPDEMAKEFVIVEEDCGDGSGWASNEDASDDEDIDADESIKGDGENGNPCVRSEETFIGCKNAGVDTANVGNGRLIKGTIQYNYDLYLQPDVDVKAAVKGLESIMLQYIGGSISFVGCPGVGGSSGSGRTLFIQQAVQTSKALVRSKRDAPSNPTAQDQEDVASIVGISSKPFDKTDPVYEECTSTNDYGVESQCVPMNGRMTYYVTNEDDATAVEEMILQRIEGGANNGSFATSPSSGTTDERILGVAFIENRAQDSARLPGNNVEQFKANGGISVIAIGLVSSFAAIFACFVVGTIASRRSKDDKRRMDRSGAFPSIADLGSLASPANNSSQDIDLEKQNMKHPDPVPTMTQSESGELLNVGSPHFNTTASMDTAKMTGSTSKTNMNENFYTVPLPSHYERKKLDAPIEARDWAAVGVTAAVLADAPGEGSDTASVVSAGNELLSTNTGSMDFGAPEPPAPPSKTDSTRVSFAETRACWEERDRHNNAP